MVRATRRTALIVAAFAFAPVAHATQPEQLRRPIQLPTDPVDPSSIAASLSTVGTKSTPDRPSTHANSEPPAPIAEQPVSAARKTDLPSYKGTVRLPLDADGEGAVLFSQSDTNRVRVVNDRIKTVIHDEGRAEITSTEDGVLFVKFAPGSSATSFYIITESLRTFKIVATLADVPAVQLLLEPRDAAPTRAIASNEDEAAGTAGHAVSVIKAMVTNQDIPAFEKRSTDAVVTIGSLQALVLAEFVGDQYVGRTLLVQPGPSRSIDEREVAREIPGTIAVLLTPTPAPEQPWIIYWVGRHV